MRKPKTKAFNRQNSPPAEIGSLVWLRARYEFHCFSYRDPRAAFSAAVALPVVSPTTVLLGICSTLYGLGRQSEAEEFLSTIHLCAVKVDPPEGAVFFRAFHQLRRYVTTQVKDTKKGPKPNIGFTEMNQGTREYALVQGPMSIYVGVPEHQKLSVVEALKNRDHIGTHDSLCSLVGDVESVDDPSDVLFESLAAPSVRLSHRGPVTVVSLARFISAEFGDESPIFWRMAGGSNTEIVPYVIPGRFTGTRSGKIYRKRG